MNGSPYLGQASAELRQTMEQMDKVCHEHRKKTRRFD